MSVMKTLNLEKNDLFFLHGNEQSKCPEITNISKHNKIYYSELDFFS